MGALQSRCAMLRDATELQPLDPMLNEIVETLPPARFAFAYGSGIVPQHGKSWSCVLHYLLVNRGWQKIAGLTRHCFET